MHRSLLIFLPMLILSCQSAQQQLASSIEDVFTKEEGTFAIAYKNMKTGETYFRNEQELFHAASTMKTPVMVEVFKQAEAGRFALSDSIVIKNEFSSIVDGTPFSLSATDDSEAELYKELGQKKSIRALVYDMIIVSSNLATNLIIELVDAKNVTATMRSVGAEKLNVLRGVEDSKAYERGMNNEVTAYDLMLLFEKIARGEMVSDRASAEMEKILLDQKFNEMIPANLPADVRVAHKTGNITGVRHDSGIAILPDGSKYVVVMLSKDLPDEEKGIKAMAEVSRLLYDYTVR